MSAIGQTAKTCQQCGKPFTAADLPVPAAFKRQKYCGSVCGHAAKKHTPEQAIAAFWSRVQKGDGCWIYTGAKLPKEIGGYGWVSFGGKRLGAHRLAWLLTNGPIAPGLHVLHKCDNGPCCNPAHLFLGTHLDNMADMYSKGRNTRGARARAKLTEEQAKLILSRKPETVRGSGALPYELAAQHGVGVGVIWCIWRGQTWRHLQEKETTV